MTNGHQKEAISALLTSDCNHGILNGYAPEYVMLQATNQKKVYINGTYIQDIMMDEGDTILAVCEMARSSL